MQNRPFADHRVPPALVCLASVLFAVADLRAQPPEPLLRENGITGGLVVVVGCEDGDSVLSAALTPAFRVHGLAPDAQSAAAARAWIQEQSESYGQVAVEHWRGPDLPYTDNLANAVLVRSPGLVPEAEIMRVLAPEGRAFILENGHWRRLTKARPGNIDRWTHYLHDSTNNPVANDTVVGPPRHLQWVNTPDWSRHHDRMASMSSLVSDGRRIFYIQDEGVTACVQLPSRWRVVARDAFNGITLWKRRIADWHFQLWPLKSGPAQLTRRLVAADDRVYVTLALRAPVTALDAGDGHTVQTYDQTRATEEILLNNGVLFLLVAPDAEAPDDPFQPDRSGVWTDTQRLQRERTWDGRARTVMAVDAADGTTLWRFETTVVPMTLTADRERVLFHDGNAVVCLDRASGLETWRSEPVSRRSVIPSSFGPNLISYRDTILFSGGDRRMHGLDAATGAVLWTAGHPPSGHLSQEDLMVVGDLVWAGNTAAGNADGVFRGRNFRTGDVVREFAPDIETYWFHHRCYRGKATVRYLLPARTGTEFVDLDTEHWMAHHWVRGGCIYGIMPCNGLLYAPPHDCACYLESKLHGFNAVAPAAPTRRLPDEIDETIGLERGPAYGDVPPVPAGPADWPTYRHDPARSGVAGTVLPGVLDENWRADLPAPLTAPVCVANTVYIGARNAHTLYALDAATGSERWRFVTGGRLDTPPTYHRGTVFLGSRDGFVYALRAADGALAWRYRVAPADRRIMAFGQLESAWPVHGGPLVHDDTLYCVAGRSMFLDQGMRLVLLDPATGGKKREVVLDNRIPGRDDGTIQDLTEILNMPVAMPDVLSCDGQGLYMRSQRFNLDGSRDQATPQPTDPVTLATLQQGSDRHLFCPAGFLDDAWFHRAYWIFGRRYSSGCNWWANAGRHTPAGRLLIFSDDKVYGYGRKPEYFQWSIPLDYHLFSCARDPMVQPTPAAERSEVSVGKSASIDPADTPLSVCAWIRPEQPDGVVLARGGASHGYALTLDGGRLSFAVRVEGELHSVTTTAPLPDGWVHVAGVISAGPGIQVFVNGRQDGEAALPGFIAADPNEIMEIGNDRGSQVGSAPEPRRFVGSIDEVRIYRRALGAAELLALAEHDTEPDREGLGLMFTFEDGKAEDISGHGNRGGVGAVPGPGRFGQGLRFDGAVGEVPAVAGPSPLPRPFEYAWSDDAPVYVRSLVLAGDTLFAAGPEDVMDEEETYRRPHDPDIKAVLAEQDAVLGGRDGAWLLAVSPLTGREIARVRLEAIPTWDGAIAAGSRLFIALENGALLSFSGSGEAPH